MPKLAARTPLQLFRERWQDCTACYLHSCRYNKAVLCRGTYPCDILFIGEAPGKSENLNGIPFCGPAGQLLEGVIMARSVPAGATWAMTNLVCCIPIDADEKVNAPDDYCIELCAPRLYEFVELCDPKIIVCVGKLVYEWLDPSFKQAIKLHKRIPLVRITHPSFILRSNQAIQGLEVQRAVIAVRNACEDFLQGDKQCP